MNILTNGLESATLLDVIEILLLAIATLMAVLTYRDEQQNQSDEDQSTED